jgi:hypothetical protein
MNDLANELLPFVPERYRAKVMLALMLSPYVTRAYHSLRNGGGLRGVARAIWFGTNVPKELNITKP